MCERCIRQLGRCILQLKTERMVTRHVLEIMI